MDDDINEDIEQESYLEKDLKRSERRKESFRVARKAFYKHYPNFNLELSRHKTWEVISPWYSKVNSWGDNDWQHRMKGIFKKTRALCDSSCCSHQREWLGITRQEKLSEISHKEFIKELVTDRRYLADMIDPFEEFLE